MNASKKKSQQLPNVLSSLFLIAYGLVTVLTPNMRTFDSNGPKFMTLSVLNLLVFVVLFFVSDVRKNRKRLFGFIDTKVGLSYVLLMVFALLSFSKAINISESVLYFAKFFTAFSAAWLVYVLVNLDKRVIIPLAVVMSLLLVVDGISMYKGVSEYITGKIPDIRRIKASYSNANIFASAVFVKLPFALWLSFFYRKLLRNIGIVGLFSGVVATFIISSRAFYLGLFLILMLLLFYAILRRKKEGSIVWKRVGLFVGILLFSFIIYTVAKEVYYPEKGKQAYNITGRLSTIADKNNRSNNLRLTAWGQSFEMLQKDPLLGVGIGNWKLRVLEYENKYSPTYTYMYKNHNDFIEIAVENGIFGGICFLLMFVFIVILFVKALLKESDEEFIKWIFLPVFGIVAYSVDAFFNFPQDRPEIQSFFAFYIGIFVALVVLLKGADSPFYKRKFGGRKYLNLVVEFLLGVFLLGSVAILYTNVKSLKFQRIVKEEVNSKKLKTPSQEIINGFPAIPNITILEEPIAVQKARFLINEKKYQEAIRMLTRDHSNPFDGRAEYFTAISYLSLNKLDSAIVYSEKAREIKPYFYGNNKILVSLYERTGKLNKAIAVLRDYVDKVKNKPKAWSILIGLLEKKKDFDGALEVVNLACKVLPNNTDFANKQLLLRQTKSAKDYINIYNTGIVLYTQKKYQEALGVFTTFLEKAPNFAKAYEFRAISYYRTSQVAKALADIEREEELGLTLKPNMLNIKAACCLLTNDKKNAKKYFLQAIKMGDKDAKNNYNKYFRKEKKKKLNFSVPK